MTARLSGTAERATDQVYRFKAKRENAFELDAIWTRRLSKPLKYRETPKVRPRVGAADEWNA